MFIEYKRGSLLVSPFQFIVAGNYFSLTQGKLT